MRRSIKKKTFRRKSTSLLLVHIKVRAHFSFVHLCNVNSWEHYVGRPIPVDSSSLDRMKEVRAGRSSLCIYDETMQDATLVHFAAIQNQPGGRLLGESKCSSFLIGFAGSTDSCILSPLCPDATFTGTSPLLCLPVLPGKPLEAPVTSFSPRAAHDCAILAFYRIGSKTFG